MKKYKEHLDLNIDFWPSYTDVLLSVILVLVFVISLMFVMHSGLAGALTAKESALAELSRQLALLEKSLQLSRDESSKLKTDLGSLSSMLESSRTELEKTRGQLGGSMAGLATAQENLTKTNADLTSAMLQLHSTEAEKAARASQIQKLSEMIGEYLKQVKTLASQLDFTKQQLATKDASLADLNAAVKGLSEQVSRLNNELGATKTQMTTQKLELGKLLAEVDIRDKEIARLRSFEKYRSEFLAQLRKVFEGVKDIRAVGDRFVFQGEVLFPSGSADLTAEGHQVLDKFVSIYKTLESRIPAEVGLNIQIQGHTDTDPIHTSEFASNWELSSARSTQVVRYLTQSGVPQNRLSAAGYAEYYPVAKGDTLEAKRQNRRIEIFFTRR